MLAAGSGGRAEILEDVEFVDPDELKVQIDETWFDKETKLKALQEICKQLELATSGSCSATSISKRRRWPMK